MEDGMKKNAWISVLFIVAGIYDGLLGLAFLLVPMRVFEWYAVTPPNHIGYVQFPAALLIVFALMFFSIAAKPLANFNLIPFGALLKLSYVIVVAIHWVPGGLPDMWKPFAVIDALFLLAFVAAYMSLRKSAGPGRPSLK
jgi:hypothetical protein